MPIMGFGRVNADISHDDLVHVVAKMQKILDYLLQGGLDWKNIRADGITARSIQANSITTEKLEAGAVTADKISVNELSAISANMGEITAGRITTNAEINVGTDARIGNNIYLTGAGGNERGIHYADTGSITFDRGTDTIEMGSLNGVYIPAGVLILGSMNVVNEINDIWAAINDLEDRVAALEGG